VTNGQFWQMVHSMLIIIGATLAIAAFCAGIALWAYLTF
jgi:hypothetical protein